MQVRVRQLAVLGTTSGEHSLLNAPLRPSPSHQLQFSPVQSDAFSLFQSIAAQVTDIN